MLTIINTVLFIRYTPVSRYDSLSDFTDKEFNDTTGKYSSKSSERLQRNPEEEGEEEL